MADFSFFRTGRFWKKVGIILTGVLLLLLVGLYYYLSPRFNEPLVTAILFHKNHRAEHEPEMKVLSDVKMEEVSIPCNGAVINALFYRKPGTPDVILMSHGNASDVDNRIEKIRLMLDSGISVLAYDYKGYGRSTGEPSIQGVIDDGVAAYDFLIDEKKYTPKNIVFYGESVGTGVSTEVARKRECKAIILESGFTSPEQRAKEKIPILHMYPSFLMMEPRMDNLDYAKGKHPPLLLFAGKQDTLIPPHHSETIFAQATEPKQLIIGPNSSHNDFAKDWELYKNGLQTFLRNNATLAEGVKKEAASPTQD
jgi:pimeloyl-ACP methyl ester carboxylesterase